MAVVWTPCKAARHTHPHSLNKTAGAPAVLRPFSLTCSCKAQVGTSRHTLCKSNTEQQFFRKTNVKFKMTNKPDRVPCGQCGRDAGLAGQRHAQVRKEHLRRGPEAVSSMSVFKGRDELLLRRALPAVQCTGLGSDQCQHLVSHTHLPAQAPETPRALHRASHLPQEQHSSDFCDLLGAQAAHEQ